MNKLFKKLADEAFFDEASSITSDIMYKFSDHKMQKFAELIVKECGKIVSGLIVPETFEQDIGPYEKWNQALGHAALEIEQEFFGDAHQ